MFEDAIQLLEHCPDQCDRSCYRCLRSFRNRFEHGLLDRHLGASLLRYLVRGEEPTLDRRRIEHAVDRLQADLSRQGLDGLEFLLRETIELPGLGELDAPILARADGREMIIGVHGPLTPDHPSDERLLAAKEFGTTIPVLLVDEIVVSHDLPAASKSVIDVFT